MKNIIQIQTILLVAFFLSLPYTLTSQDDSKERKVRVKTIKEVDGEKVVTDTTFYVSADDDVKKVVEQITVNADGDSTANVMIDVMVDVEKDVEWESESGNKVVIIKKSHGGDEDVRIEKKVIIINGDGDEEHVMVLPHGKHKVMKWEGEDGESYEFDFDYDIDVDMEGFDKDMAELHAEMKDIQMRIVDEEGNIHKEMIMLEHMAEMEELEKMHNVEVIRVPSDRHHAPHGHDSFVWKSSGSMGVTDEELRDAGIKNKPDRLDLEEIDIEKEEGVVDLSFVIKEEGSPKVDVYNIYGDKVFSGKPELMNDSYKIKMDLSKKQHGTYYLMIVLGNSSKTLRLKI